MKHIVAILVLLFLFVQSAKAAEWGLFAEDNDQYYYIDKKALNALKQAVYGVQDVLSVQLIVVWVISPKKL